MADVETVEDGAEKSMLLPKADSSIVLPKADSSIRSGGSKGSSFIPDSTPAKEKKQVLNRLKSEFEDRLRNEMADLLFVKPVDRDPPMVQFCFMLFFNLLPFLSFLISIPTMPSFMEEVGASVSFSGWCIAAFPLGNFVTMIPYSWFFQWAQGRYRHHYTLTAAVSIHCACATQLMYGFTHHVNNKWYIFWTRFLMGASSYQALANIWVANTTGKNKRAFYLNLMATALFCMYVLGMLGALLIDVWCQTYFFILTRFIFSTYILHIARFFFFN